MRNIVQLSIGIMAVALCSALSMPASPAHVIDNVLPTITESPSLIKDALNGGPAQIPLFVCPEFVGLPLEACSLGSCGGESTQYPGHCNNFNPSNWRCQCAPDAPISMGPVTSVIEATLSGETATGTFELETITQFTTLRQSITVTETATDTASGGTGLETAAAVIFAGGVAWFLADISGSAAAISAIEPPTGAENHDDDQSCANPKNQCSDCGGDQNRVCTSGKDTGCACDAETCPIGDDQPSFSDNACTGKDGKCTTGDNQNCECKEQPECPTGIQTLHCSKCGGQDANGKCVGLQEYNYLWKGCDCIAVKGQIPYTPDTIANMRAAQIQIQNLPPPPSPISSSIASVSSTSTPWCHHGASLEGGRLPQGYCQCGDNYATTYSEVKSTTSPYNACPYTTPPPEGTVIWTTPGISTTSVSVPPITTIPPPAPSTTTKTTTCDPYWCGAPFCGPCP